MEAKTITYEQPLNEHTRVALRLEYLFKQAKYYLQQDNIWDLHNAVVTIIEWKRMGPGCGRFVLSVKSRPREYYQLQEANKRIRELKRELEVERRRFQ